METRDAVAGEVVVSSDRQCADMLWFSQCNNQLDVHLIRCYLNQSRAGWINKCMNYKNVFVIHTEILRLSQQRHRNLHIVLVNALLINTKVHCMSVFNL